MKTKFLEDLDKIDHLAKASKVSRLLKHPFRYVYAISFKEFIYPRNKREKLADATLFYGKRMKIALPAATDIFLTGGKSHPSEVRLAKFLVMQLNEGSRFLDIGAHFGYFTLLASELVGPSGKVVSFEPAGKSYQLLAENTLALNNVTTFKKAVSNTEDKLTFFEFPNLHSEYNTSDVSQFEGENWFRHSPPVKKEIEATTIDVIVAEMAFNPAIVKIDVEGAEWNVIQGGREFFQQHSPKIVMEYLAPQRKNESHRKAHNLLESMGYQSHIIKSDGKLHLIEDIDSYLVTHQLESDNIVFLK